MQRFDKEAFGGLGIAPRAQEQLQGGALRVDGPLEVHPRFSDFDGGLVDFPGGGGGFEVRPAAFFQLWGHTAGPNERSWDDRPRVRAGPSSLPSRASSMSSASTNGRRGEEAQLRSDAI